MSEYIDPDFEDEEEEAPAPAPQLEAEAEVAEGDGAEIQVNFAEGRVLGCLLEKEVTTPDHYPMTVNALQTACNQKSSRDPVTEFDSDVIERALEGLRDKHLAVKFHMAGSRALKYKHTLDRVSNMDEAQRALICVLLLRGTQTAGELNQRTDRLHKFGSVQAVEHTLGTLIDYPTGPMVKQLPAGGGRRVVTYGHLLSGDVDSPAGVASPAQAGPVSPEQIVLEEEASWRKKQEDEIAALKAEIVELKSQFDQFRQQFE